MVLLRSSDSMEDLVDNWLAAQNEEDVVDEVDLYSSDEFDPESESDAEEEPEKGSVYLMQSLLDALRDVTASKSQTVNPYGILDALQDLKDRAVSTNTIKHFFDQLVAAQRFFRDNAVETIQMNDEITMIDRLIIECEMMI